MALVTELSHAPQANPEWKTTVTCGYLIAEVKGRTVLHLETYGSAERRVLGKASQYLAFDEAAARHLVGLLAEAFPSIFSDAMRALSPQATGQGADASASGPS